MANDWEKDLDALLDKVPGLQNNPSRQNPRNAEIDATQLLMQRLMQQGMAPQTNAMPAQPSHERVEIREGTIYYTNVPAEMSNFTIAMKAGPIQDTIGKEFIFKGYRDVLLIESNQAIDLSTVDKSNLRRMCIVEAVWLGTIIVPESAIVRTGRKSKKIIISD